MPRKVNDSVDRSGFPRSKKSRCVCFATLRQVRTAGRQRAAEGKRRSTRQAKHIAPLAAQPSAVATEGRPMPTGSTLAALPLLGLARIGRPTLPLAPSAARAHAPNRLLASTNSRRALLEFLSIGGPLSFRTIACTAARSYDTLRDRLA